MTGKSLPLNITSYDLLKTFAVIAMIIDHLGHYEFVDSEWMRIIGRLCVPVWMFLIGYANSREIPKLLWGGGLLLIIANFISGIPILPLNILITIIIIRLSIDFIMRESLKNFGQFIGMALLLTLLALPTNYMTEYGTNGIIIAMFGYVVRHQKESGNNMVLIGVMLFSCATFMASQQLIFDFPLYQSIFMICSLLAVHIMLLDFKACEYPKLTKRLPHLATRFIQLGGRHTLEIYIIHLLLFKALALMLGISENTPFSFALI